jgi:hypothetical protein
MIRELLQSALCLTLCPLLVAQQANEPGTVTQAKPETTTGNQPKPSKVVRIPADSSVRLRLEQQISSADAHVGERVRFTIEGGLEVGNRIVVPDGTAFFATVTAVRARTTDHYGEVRFSDPELDLGSGQRIRLTGSECIAVPGACVAVGAVGAVTLVPITVAMLPATAVMFIVDRLKQDRAQRRLTALGAQKPLRTEETLKGDRSKEEYPQGTGFEYYTRQGARIRPILTAAPVPIESSTATADGDVHVYSVEVR